MNKSFPPPDSISSVQQSDFVGNLSVSFRHWIFALALRRFQASSPPTPERSGPAKPGQGRSTDQSEQLTPGWPTTEIAPFR